MSNKAIELELPTDGDTIWKIARLVYANRRINRRLVLLVSLGGAALATGVVYAISDGNSTGFWAAMFVGVALLTAAGGWIGGWVGWWFQTRSAVAVAAGQESGVAMRLDAKTVFVQAEGATASTDWVAFERIVEASDYVLLYCGPQFAWYVPLDGLSWAERTEVQSWWTAARA